MISSIWRRGVLSALVAGFISCLAPAIRAIDYANIDVVDGAVPHVDPPTATIPAGQSTTAGVLTEGFFLDSSAVVGEIPIRIGASAANDLAGGVLIASVREIGRTPAGETEPLFASVSTVTDDHFTSTNARNTTGGLAIVTDRAGANIAAGGSNYPVGAAMNANVAAAYFPFSQGWVGGTALSDTDGGAYNQLIASAGLQLGTHVQQDFFGPGDNKIVIPGVQDTRRQGILLGMTAHNEDNFAAVSHTANGDGFNLTTRANSADGGTAETDPVSFVFIPLGTPNLTMGSIFGITGQNQQPLPLLASGSPFTVVRDDLGNGSTGAYRLSITGESPTSGTLIVQTTSNLDGDGGNPADNLISYRAEGNDWIIFSDDLPNTAAVPNASGGLAGQGGAMGERQPHFQFVFMPFDAPPTAPGALPQLDWTRESVLGANVVVTEVDGLDNDQNDGTIGMYATAPTATTNVTALPLRLNRGDISVAFDSVLPTLGDGVMFATLSEGLRDNSATGGPFEYGVVGVSLTGDPASWEVHTSIADPTNGEHNINFAVAFFGSETGFQMAAEHPLSIATGMVGHADITVPGVNSLTDGVLMVTPHGNDDNFATVEPKADGTGWDVDHYDNGTGREGPTGTNTDSINWIYLPYTTENLVAGRVNPDGTIINSTGVGTNPGEFTLTRDAAGEYLLSVAGRTPDQGMLLLNATGPAGSLDNSMVYEADGNAFRIIGLDMITSTESAAGEFVETEDTGFSFAFIDFITPPTLPGGDFAEADFNNSGVVDGADLAAWQAGFGTGTTKAQGDADADSDVDGNDFLVWQRQLGTTTTVAAAGAVPEPNVMVLTLLAGVGLLARTRQRTSVD